ncbi:MAG: tetratricopeptide repeat protein [Spirulinaceae cyanobacterium RM2_2_10]|nr:tetratricopeptide repeat protein [Spirulinaceae cyanobacterium SM2_1_0]NJO19760.1 tetratricopeptide repeat protein [Spirulinaceae cyanobacterium RM2_2_10]
MDDARIQPLLADLQSDTEATRRQATTRLWQLWFNQKGEPGMECLQRAQACLEFGDVVRAEQLLSETISRYPDFAEAWNRRAVLYYALEDYPRSCSDCQRVVQLNPVHFGAWHGIGLCQMELGDYSEAITAFRQALAIQPYATTNQQLILECTLRLN